MKKKTSLENLTDRTPRYTVKQMAEKMGLTAYAVRYYDNAGLIPDVWRSSGNSRLFSDYNLAWLKIVHCLRSTGLPITEVRRYIQMCQEGDSTIPERAAIIAAQEKSLRAQLDELNSQMEILEYKKHLQAKTGIALLKKDLLCKTYSALLPIFRPYMVCF